MNDRKWKLGDDLIASDSLLDGVTFDDLILAVRCNCQVIDRAAVYSTLNEILAIRRQEMRYLLENNMEAIIEMAKIGRGGAENDSV